MWLITPEGALLANNLGLFVLTKATYSMFYLADILALRHIVIGFGEWANQACLETRRPGVWNTTIISPC